MKQLKLTFSSLFTIVFFTATTLFISSCSKDEPIPKPTVSFSYSQINSSTIQFNTKTTNAWLYAWDFGDGTTSIQADSTTHQYTESGNYLVTLTVKNHDYDSAVYSDSITVKYIYDPGLIDFSAWKLTTNGAGITFDEKTLDNGSLIEIKGEDRTNGTQWAGGAIYQEIKVDAGTYKLDGKFEIVTDVIADTWCEVFFGPVAPVDGQDYSPGDQYLELQFSTWNGSPLAAGTYDFSGPNTYNTSSGNYPEDGLYTFDAPTSFFLVIKSGSKQDPIDFKFDNLSFVKQ